MVLTSESSHSLLSFKNKQKRLSFDPKMVNSFIQKFKNASNID